MAEGTGLCYMWCQRLRHHQKRQSLTLMMHRPRKNELDDPRCPPNRHKNTYYLTSVFIQNALLTN